MRNKIIFVFFGISLFFIIAFFGFDEVLLNSLFYGRDSIGLEDASGRKQVWKYLINAGLEKPLIGYGFASGELSLLSVSSWKGAY